MFNDEFYYKPKFAPFFKSICMKYESEGGEGGEGEGGEGGSGDGGEGGESWLDQHDYLSDEDRTTLAKYKTHEDALKGSANAIRQVGKSVRFPDDTTSEEDRAKFDTKVAEYQGVPAKPDDYMLERPKKLPEGMTWDEDMEAWFREKIHAAKTPQDIAKQLFDAYCERMIEGHNVYQAVAKASEKELRDELKNDFEVWFGNPKDKESIGTIKQTVLWLSDKLGLDYKGEDDSPQSKLADCLELKRHNGCLGDMTPILKVLNFVYTNHVAEASTVSSDLSGIKTEKGGNLFDFEDMDDNYKGGDDYGLG